MDRITCLIPTFNRRALVVRAIASALGQEVAGLQVAVFDNHSHDGTGECLAAISRRDARLRYTIHPHNIGGFLNFNAAFASVRTPYFSILSDDDLLLPGFYAEALAYLERHPQCGMYCGNTLHALADGRVRYSSNHLWSEGYYPPGRAAAGIRHFGHPTWTGIVFRRELLSEVTLRADAGSPADTDFELEAGERVGAYVTRRPAAVLTMSVTTASSTKPLAWVYPCWEEVMRRHCPRFGQARTADVLFLSDRYFADLLSLLNQSTLPAADRAQVLRIIAEYPFWSGVGNRIARLLLLSAPEPGPGQPRYRVALLLRKLAKLIEQPRLVLDFLKQRRAERVLRGLGIFRL